MTKEPTATTLRQYVLGMQGVALLRLWLIGDPTAVQARLEEVRELAARLDEPGLAASVLEPELDPTSGYSRWAATYDGPNAAITREERAVHPLLETMPPGRALDAACGTGRYAAYLTARGHTVVGVDASPQMLARARARVPGADFRLGHLEALPIEDQSADLAICALALTHCIDLAPPIQELARVVRPGGRVIVSDIHPFLSSLGGHALFRDAAGKRAFVRNRAHPHSSYFDAFASAGLTVTRCLEPLLTADLLPPALTPEILAAQRDAFVGLPGSLIWDLRRD